MKQQKEMVESFLRTHRDFMKGLENSFKLIERDLKEAADFDAKCTGEWCITMEKTIDELAKCVYSISEPRWLQAKDSEKIHDMRQRIHDTYAKFKGISTLYVPAIPYFKELPVQHVNSLTLPIYQIPLLK